MRSWLPDSQLLFERSTPPHFPNEKRIYWFLHANFNRYDFLFMTICHLFKRYINNLTNFQMETGLQFHTRTVETKLK